MRYTKMLVTIGPATYSRKIMEDMVLLGVDGCRINFSHTSYEQAEKLNEQIRDISRLFEKPISIRQDLQGPKIRVGQLKYEYINLKKDDIISLVTDAMEGNEDKISVSEAKLIDSLSVDSTVIIGDNDIKMKVVEKKNNEAKCQAIYDGIIKPNKGISAPGSDISFSGLTQKDFDDLRFGIKQKMDCVSLSFVQDENDIKLLKDELKKFDSKIPVIAKIEKYNSIKNLDNIIDAADGISIARGDLAVEMPLEEIGVLQKEIIRRCNKAGKFVMVGSGILSSCKNNPWPEKSEISDITLLVSEGVDAISLSDETAIGKYPVETVRHLANIIEVVETSIGINQQSEKLEITDLYKNTFNDFEHVNTKSPIIVNTDSMDFVLKIAKMYYAYPIIVSTGNEYLANYLGQYWGIYSVLYQGESKTEDRIDFVINKAKSMGLINDESSFVKVEEAKCVK